MSRTLATVALAISLAAASAQAALEDGKTHKIAAGETIELELTLETGANLISGRGSADADLDYYIYDAGNQLILVDTDLSSRLLSKKTCAKRETLKLIVKNNSEKEATLILEISPA